MSADEKSIRVAITFNAEGHSDWFDLMSKVKSGRGRSEILRAHLLPPSDRVLAKFSNSPTPTASHDVVPARKPEPKSEAASPNPPALQVSQESRAHSPKEGTVQANRPAPQPHAESSRSIPGIGNSDVRNESKNRRSGLASSLIKQGMNDLQLK